MHELASITPDRDPWFIELWLHDRPAHTQRAYRREIERFRMFTQKPLPLITLEDMQAYQDSLLDLAPASRNRALATIKSALSFGMRMNYLPTNVGLLVKLRRPAE